MGCSGQALRRVALDVAERARFGPCLVATGTLKSRFARSGMHCGQANAPTDVKYLAQNAGSGCGLAIRWPWAKSTPSSRTADRISGWLTNSATVGIFMIRASSMKHLTVTLLIGSVCRPLTNCPSILRLSTLSARS